MLSDFCFCFIFIPFAFLACIFLVHSPVMKMYRHSTIFSIKNKRLERNRCLNAPLLQPATTLCSASCGL
jgi:hypothetical protein